jgi:hypothetical protein
MVKANFMIDENLVAVCGLYCGACSIYWATQNEDEQKLKDFAQGLSAKTGKDFSIDDVLCDGCLKQGRLDLWCRHCQIRLCDKLQSGKIRCSDCDEFPCSRLTDFKNDGMKHHIEIIENLKHIREIGVEAWATYEKERWTCPKCKNILSWYDLCCPNCKTQRSKLLFKI